MLTLLGRSATERAKSVAVVLLGSVLIVSLWEVSTGHSAAVREQQERETVIVVARRFAVALTTYDYAHPNVQLSNVAALGSMSVFDRASGSSADVAAAKASSQGDATSAVVVTVDGAGAEVVVTTVQVVSSSYTGTGATLTGLLDVTVSRSGRGWIVTDYRWLQAPESRG
jgi:hypothetical protein